MSEEEEKQRFGRKGLNTVPGGHVIPATEGGLDGRVLGFHEAPTQNSI